MTPLSNMTPGQKGKIVGFTDNSNLSRRLFELGIIPGRCILYLRDAPLKDPMAVQVGMCCLSLRRSEASLVVVEVDSH